MSAVAGRPPSLSPRAVCKLVMSYFKGKHVNESSIKCFPSYDDRNYYLSGELSDCTGSEFVLKLGNLVYVAVEHAEGINKLMCHISSKGFKFSVPCPLLSSVGSDCLLLTADETSRDTQDSNGVDMVVSASRSTSAKATSQRYHVRLLSYIPGEMFDVVEKEYLTPAVLSDVGETLATIDKELKVLKFSDYSYVANPR